MQNAPLAAALIAAAAALLIGMAARSRPRAGVVVDADLTMASVLASIASAPSRSAAIDITLDAIVALAPGGECAFYVTDERRALVREATRGPCTRMPLRLAAYQGVIGQAAATTSVFETPADRAAAGGGYLLACPVRRGDDVDGVLAVASVKRVRDRERALIERLAENVAARLAALREHDQLESLASLVAAGNDALKAQASHFEQAHRVHSRFAAEVTQALRKPLTAIIADAEVLRDGVPGDLNERQREFIVDIIQSGEEALGFIGDIADLAKLEAGMMPLAPRDIDAARLFHDVTNTLQRKFAARSVALSTHVDAALAPLRLDAGVVTRIASNLLLNALQLTPPQGDATLTVQRAWRHDAAGLQICVASSGPGIASGDQAHLFEPWVQVSYALSNGLRDAWVGVAIVRRLAELHGGTVDVASEPGEGATFTVWLPEVVAGAPRDATMAVHEAHVRKAIVIDPDNAGADALAQLLRDAGLDVTTAVDLSTGLASTIDPAIALLALSASMKREHMTALLMARHDHDGLARLPVLLAPDAVAVPVDDRAARLRGALSALGLAAPRAPSPVVLALRSDQALSARVVASYPHARVIVADNAADALAEASAEQPDLILFDAGGPDAWHLEIIDLMQALRETRAIPMVAMAHPLARADDASRDANATQRSDAPAWMHEVVAAAQTGGGA